MAYLRTEAVVIRRRNFGEADRIITFYTRDFGKLSALAKGARRPSSKKAGHLELGSWCKIFVARGKNLDLLTEVETKRAFGISDFKEERANRIYHLLELVDALTADHQKNLQIFILLVHFLKKLETEEDFNLISGVFKVKLLSMLGFFSASSLKDSKTKNALTLFEKVNFDEIKMALGPQSRAHRGTRTASSAYLKLLAFLDSMIENLTETRLKTVRFLDG